MTKYEDSRPALMPEEKEQIVNLQETLARYLYHWPVFLVGILLSLVLAFVYLRYAQPIYMVSSTLLIKDEKKGSMPTGGDLLNELDLFGTSKIVDNEIEILKSKTLMRKVVDHLNLSVSLKVEGRLRNSDLYSSNLVNIDVIQMDSAYFGKTLQLTLVGASSYILEDPESKLQVKGKLDQLQRNIYGVYRINKGKKFNFSSKLPLSLTIHDPLIVVDQYLNELNVDLASKQSSVLDLSIQSAFPQKGQAILNTLVQVYNEAGLADKNKTTQSTMQFIDDRLKLITGELTDVERDVESFKSTRGLTDISNDASVFLENVKTNDAKLNEIKLQISVINDITRYVNSNSPHEKLPSTLGINDPVLIGQINQLSELQLQMDQLLATTTENNPMVAPLQKQVETTRAGIKATIANISKSLEVSRNSLENNNAQFQSSIKKIPGQERQLISIERQKTIKESLYLYLLQKKEEAALSYASAVADSRTVDPAFYSKVPIKPRGKLVYITSLILGILLPAGYVYGKNILNNKVEDSMDLVKLTSVPLLGEVLLNESSEAIVVQANSRKAIAEQFRSIRTNMQFLHGNQRSGMGHVTLFTSGMSGEGKSFVASNIAAALAISGKKTVLLELDLRKPKISNYLGLTNQIGLSNYLIGKARVEDIIKPSNVDPNFFVIGSGPIPPNPSELLENLEIEELVKILKGSFDEILIDTPPIGLVTDAQILGRLADATIYIVRQNVTFKGQVHNLDNLYRNQKLPRINVILNGVKLGGNYGYGYGYGYYSDDLLAKETSFKSIFRDLLKRF